MEKKISRIFIFHQLLTKLGEKGYSENIEIFIEIKDAQGKFFTENETFKNYES